MSDHPHLKTETRSSTGIVTLDRQEALNALSMGMCEAMAASLEAWAGDSSIDRVLVRAAPGRAFCAGGDVRSIAPGLKDDPAEGERYFRVEYGLDMLVNAYPKPVVVLADGLTMGGGAGVLLNASHPVVTTAVDFAMPETTIGLFPDVGASFFLRRAPRATAVFLGITGWRIGAGDLLRLGIAPLAVESDAAAAVIDAVIGAPGPEDVAGAIDAALEGFRAEPAPAEAPVAGAAEWIAKRVDAPDPVSIRAGLEGDGHPMAAKAREALAEGVRARLIDKDNSPNWQPARLEGVTREMVEAMVTPEGFDLPGLAAPATAPPPKKNREDKTQCA